VCAGAASLIIIVNAIFLQSGTHPAPFFTNPAALVPTSGNRFTAASAPATIPQGPNQGLNVPSTSSPPARTSDRAVETPARGSPSARTQAGAHRVDPIGDLIGNALSPASTSSVGSARIIAVQRALSEFGYGQLRQTGALDEPTSVAIQKFEAEHQLPVTGRISDRFVSELAAMTGRPIQ
jgi:Putative peptidoglycan binding domain